MGPVFLATSTEQSENTAYLLNENTFIVCSILASGSDQ